MSAETVLEIDDLVAGYGERPVLDGVSLALRRGEILVLVGASGSGKSTLLKHAIGLLAPESGSVRFFGRDIVPMDEEERSEVLSRIGVSFQSSGLFNSLTVAENVALPLRERGSIDDETTAAVVRLKLSLVGLEGTEERMPHELSGGMRKRVSVARAIALDPEILFFDEPTAGLDPILSADLDVLTLRLRDLLGISCVVVTHELDSIRMLADRVVMLDGGKVVFEGTREEIDRSKDPRVRQFFDRVPDPNGTPQPGKEAA
ncbi:MAG TPA: ATP-binding cassette domain-containing protein [Planctomycetota bacterium]|nr:ATP-binding cassette domain-containing protein [Planctomycetota bacterium]